MLSNDNFSLFTAHTRVCVVWISVSSLLLYSLAIFCLLQLTSLLLFIYILLSSCNLPLHSGHFHQFFAPFLHWTIFSHSQSSSDLSLNFLYAFYVFYQRDILVPSSFSIWYDIVHIHNSNGCDWGLDELCLPSLHSHNFPLLNAQHWCVVLPRFCPLHSLSIDCKARSESVYMSN